jgi:uncharacterized membrane protein
MRLPRISNPIRWVAVVCVAVTSFYVMYMSYTLLQTLSGPGWCRTALGAEKSSATEGTIKGLDACVGLLQIQLKSLANNSYIFGGVIALCLLTLIVIVIAGGYVSFDFSKTGASGTIGRQPQTPAAKAATEVAGAAVDKAGDVIAADNGTAKAE